MLHETGRAGYTKGYALIAASSCAQTEEETERHIGQAGFSSWKAAADTGHGQVHVCNPQIVVHVVVFIII